MKTERTDAGDQGLLGPEFSRRSVPTAKIQREVQPIESVTGSLWASVEPDQHNLAVIQRKEYKA